LPPFPPRRFVSSIFCTFAPAVVHQVNLVPPPPFYLNAGASFFFHFAMTGKFWLSVLPSFFRSFEIFSPLRKVFFFFLRPPLFSPPSRGARKFSPFFAPRLFQGVLFFPLAPFFIRLSPLSSPFRKGTFVGGRSRFLLLAFPFKPSRLFWCAHRKKRLYLFFSSGFLVFFHSRLEGARAFSPFFQPSHRSVLDHYDFSFPLAGGNIIFVSLFFFSPPQWPIPDGVVLNFLLTVASFFCIPLRCYPLPCSLAGQSLAFSPP